MNNHLSYRWPEGAPTPSGPPKRRKRRALRTALILLACIVGVAALAAGACLGVLYTAERLMDRAEQPDVVPSGSVSPSSASSEASWTPADLPWGDPEPGLELSLSQPVQQELTPQEIYQQVLPSVVYVQAKQKDSSSYSVGSGIVLTDSGYIVTNYHIIEGGDELLIMLLTDETVYDAVLIGYDEELDLAVLKSDAQDLTPASFADSDLLEVGDTVYAIGNPMGYLYGSMTSGIVSSLARQVDFDDHTMTLIQTSAALNSGSSGGALVDVCGQVVGITVAKITGIKGNTVVEGIGLAIPITDGLPFINHIIQTGTTCRPALGILCYETQVDGQKGILVDEVTSGTPAEGLLQPGDLIVAADGKPVAKLYDLTRILYAAGVDGAVELTVRRGVREISIRVPLYDRLAQSE